MAMIPKKLQKLLEDMERAPLKNGWSLEKNPQFHLRGTEAYIKTFHFDDDTEKMNFILSLNTELQRPHGTLVQFDLIPNTNDVEVKITTLDPLTKKQIINFIEKIDKQYQKMQN